MPLYNENATFGTKAFALTGLTNEASIYVGSEIGPKTTEAAAKAIDTSCARKYKDKYYFRINEIEAVSGTGLTYLDLIFYSLASETATNASATSFVKLRVSKDALEQSKRTPIEVSIPSSFGRYIRLEIGTNGTAAVKGALLVTAEETWL